MRAPASCVRACVRAWACAQDAWRLCFHFAGRKPPGWCAAPPLRVGGAASAAAAAASVWRTRSRCKSSCTPPLPATPACHPHPMQRRGGYMHWACRWGGVCVRARLSPPRVSLTPPPDPCTHLEGDASGVPSSPHSRRFRHPPQPQPHPPGEEPLVREEELMVPRGGGLPCGAWACPAGTQGGGRTQQQPATQPARLPYNGPQVLRSLICAP